jgi:WD40 repeat protein
MGTVTTMVQLPMTSVAPERAQVTDLRRLGSFGRGALWSVAFLPDGSPVSVGGFGVRVHDADTLAVVKELDIGIGVRRIAVHPGGALALVVGFVGPRLVLAEVSLVDGAVRVIPDTRKAGWYGAEGLAWSADGRRAFFGAGESLYVWDRETGETQLWGPPVNEALPMQRWVTVATGEVTFKREQRKMGRGQWVAVSPDGVWVVASDGNVQTVWDTQRGVAVRTLKNDLDGLAFDADGRLLMGDGYRLAQVDLNTAEVTLTQMHLPSGGPDVVAVSPARRFVVSATTWGDARVQSLPGLEPVGVIGAKRGGGWQGHTLDVAACSEDRLLVYDSRLGELGLFTLPGLRLLATQAGHNWGLIDVSADDDLNRLVWLTDGERTLWDLRVTTGALQEHAGRVYRAALSPHGELLATGLGYNFAKKTLSVTDPAGATLDAFDSRSGLRPLRFSPSGALYSVCEGTSDGYRDGKPGEVSIRKPGQPRVIKRIKLPKMPWSADISRDDARVAVVWDDGVGLYSLPKGTELLKVTMPEYGEAVAAHPVAPRLAVTSKLRGGGGVTIADVTLYEVGTLGPAARFSPPAHATALAFSAGGELLYVGLEDGTLLVLDGETLALLHSLRGHNEEISVVQVTSRGVITCALDGQILLWGV